MLRETKSICRGERLRHTVSVAYPEIDFSGATFTAHVRSSPEGGLLHACSLTVTTTSVGSATVAINIPGAVTRLFPERAWLDISVAKPSASFGPWKPYRLALIVEPSFTVDPEEESIYRYSGVELKDADGEYVRIVATTDGGISITDPTGENRYDSIDLLRPDLAYASLDISSEGQMTGGDAQGANQWPHIELTIDGGGYVRITVDNAGQITIHHIEA